MIDIPTRRGRLLQLDQDSDNEEYREFEDQRLEDFDQIIKFNNKNGEIDIFGLRFFKCENLATLKQKINQVINNRIQLKLESS